MNGKFFLILIVAAVLGSGCAAKQDLQVETALPSGSYKKELEEYRMRQILAQKPNPSLWAEVGSRGTLFLDYKGRTVGDIIVVQITETSSASNSNSTTTNKSTTYSSGITNLLGMPTNLGIGNFLNQGNSLDPTIQADTANAFAGSGAKSKADTVSGTVAARIIEVLPSGNLVIEGHREIIVDQEKQIITIRGIVRQKDVNANNMVQSTQIADAQISYSGKGVISDANKKGWLASAIDWVWPF